MWEIQQLLLPIEAISESFVVKEMLLRLFYVASMLLPKCFDFGVDPSRQSLAQ